MVGECLHFLIKTNGKGGQRRAAFPATTNIRPAKQQAAFVMRHPRLFP